VERLRIGIDGYNLALPNGTGVATYGTVLGRTLAAAGHRIEGVFGIDPGREPAIAETQFFDALARAEPRRRTRLQFSARWLNLRAQALRPGGLVASEVPLTDRVEKAAFADRLPPFERIVTRAGLFDIAHRRFVLTGRMLTLRLPDPPAIMHWTYPVPVRLAGARNIYTLHDLVPLKLPYTTLDAKRIYHALVGACVAEAAQICTVSEASRADILSFFPTDPGRVTNTYQASPLGDDATDGDPEGDAAAVRGTFGLERDGYFLFFGAVEPKKNVGRLLQAYLGTEITTPLVIVGARAWKSEGELALLPEQSDRIVRLPYLPRALLLKLVRGARAVLFPSLYEGFGLPVLEALQLGTPVLTSRTSSLPEVAGDAAVYVDPYQVPSIAEAMTRLDRDSGLRARLASAGPVQATQFSTARYVERLDRLYEAALGR
jgi:glycosyltransferase involved in cell wall biosynthesis